MYEVVNHPGLSEVSRQELDEVETGEVIIDESGVRWEKIKVKLDTGAVDWVFTPEAGQAFRLTDSQLSEAGIPYYAANGTEIKNHGQRNCVGYSGDWVPMAVNVNVADVRSNLGGGMPIIQADNRIILDKDGSYILNKRTGSAIQVNHENGAFTFDFWVRAPTKSGSGGAKKGNQDAKDKPKKVSPGRYQALAESEEDEADEMDIGQLEAVFIGQEDLM